LAAYVAASSIACTCSRRRDDVAGDAAADQADVGRGGIVDAAQGHVGDRPGRGDDRASALLGRDPRVGGAAQKAKLERLLGRCREHDVADGRRMVVAEPEPGVQPAEVEGLGAVQADLLHGRQHELHAGVRGAVGQAGDRGQHHRDRGLVVGTEDRVPAVDDDAVSHLGLDRPVGGHRVEMGVQENRSPLAGGGGETAVDVADVRPDPRAGVVLVRLESQPAEELEHAVGHGPLLAGWAGDGGQVAEELDHAPHLLGAHGRSPFAVAACWSGISSPYSGPNFPHR
jgi:hypothetical protein